VKGQAKRVLVQGGTVEGETVLIASFTRGGRQFQGNIFSFVGEKNNLEWLFTQRRGQGRRRVPNYLASEKSVCRFTFVGRRMEKKMTKTMARVESGGRAVKKKRGTEDRDQRWI